MDRPDLKQRAIFHFQTEKDKQNNIFDCLKNIEI